MFRKNNPSVLHIDGDTVRVITAVKNKTGFSILGAFEAVPGKIQNITLKLEKKQISLLFPRELAVIRNLEIAEENKESLPVAIAAEIEDGLPFAKEKVSWDSEILGKKNNKSNGLFAATSRDSINEYTKNLRSNGLELEAIIPSSLALYEVYRISKAYTKEPVLLVLQGRERTDIVVVENDLIITSRGFKTRGENGEIIENIKQTLDSVVRSNILIKKIIIGSSLPDSSTLKEKINKLPGIEAEELKLPDAVLGELKILGAEGNGWELLVGMVLIELGFSKLNLDLGKNTLQKTEKLSTIRFIKRSSYAVISFMLFLSLVLGIVNGCKRTEVDGLRAELSTLSVLAGKQWSQTVRAIFNAVPGRVILSEFNIDNKGDIVLRGNAETSQDVTAFLDTLNKVRGFNAKLGYANDIQAGNKQTVQFQMKIQQKYNMVKNEGK